MRYTFHTIKRLLRFLLVRWVLKYVLVIFWQAPAQVWGWWVILGGYGLVLGFVGVMCERIAVERWLAYGILWGFLARWRWNQARLKQDVRPLFERRDDL